MMMSLRQENHSDPDHDSCQAASRGLRVLVCTYVYVPFLRHIVRTKESKNSGDLFFSLQLGVEDEGRLEVPESPLHAA